MGRGDKRRSPKMRRLAAQKKLKERIKRRLAEAKADKKKRK